MPKLVVAIDGVVLKEVPLVKQRTTLGRRPYNDIVIDNLAVSGEHAVLHLDGADVQIEDLHSTNGTYINGRAIRRQSLGPNDVIEIGKHKLRFVPGVGADESLFSGRGSSGDLPRVSGAVPLTAGATAPMPLADGSTPAVAVVRVLSGSGAGREVPLQKVVTTLGRPGVAVAAVTRRLQGYVVAPVDGPTLLNGQTLAADGASLHDGDMLDVGGTRMQFVSL